VYYRVIGWWKYFELDDSLGTRKARITLPVCPDDRPSSRRGGRTAEETGLSSARLPRPNPVGFIHINNKSKASSSLLISRAHRLRQNIVYVNNEDSEVPVCHLWV